MDYLDDLESSFQTRISQIFELSRLPNNIIELSTPSYDSIESSLDEIQGFHNPKNKISNQIKLLRNISKNEGIRRQFDDFNSQIVVLMVGATEAYLYDVVMSIGDNNPEMFVFENGGGKPKVIAFDSSLLNHKTSVGEIMRHYFKEKDDSVSFQDVQSIVRFFENRLSCYLEIEDYQDVLIFATAARNVIVHNNQIIDDKFLTQIRDTAYIDHKVERDGKTEKKFIEGRTLAVTATDIKEIQEALLNMIAEIGAKVRENNES